MSMYITRNVGFRENSTVSPTLFMNFLRSAELGVVENTDMQYVLSGGRDARRIAWLMEEPDVRVEFDPLSFYTMYWAMGSISGAASAWTIVPSSTLPLITTWREMTDVGTSPSESGIKTLKIYDGKVNSYELNFGKGEVATANMSIMGKGANLGTTVATQTVDYTKEPMAFYDADVFVNGSRLSTSTLPDVAISIMIENNCTRRPTVSTVYGYRPYVIAEGGLDVSGRLTVGAYALSALGEVIDRAGDNTIQLRVNKAHGGNFTSTITMPQVLFTDFPERLRGIEPYEVEIPFQCLPLGSEPPIKVVMSSTILKGECMSITDSPLTLDQIINNSPVTIFVPGVGNIVVRRPKVGDNKAAKRKLMAIENYDKLSESEKEEQFNIFLIQSIVVNPNLSDIDEIDFAKFQAIFDVISMWLTAETVRLSDERKNMMTDFLSLVRGKNQSSSTDS